MYLVLVGVVLGLSTMTRTHTVFMPLVVFAAYWMKDNLIKKALFAGLTVFFIGQILCLPWTLRNWHYFKTFVPYTAANYYIYDGFNSEIKHGYETSRPLQFGDEDYDPILDKAKIENDVKTFQRLAAKGIIGFMVNHPKQALRIMVEREYAFLVYNPNQLGCWVRRHIDETNKFKPEIQSSYNRKILVGAAYLGSYYLLLTFFILGVIFLITKWTHKLTIYFLCIGFYLAEHLIIYPDWKYRYPIEVLMIPIAAYAIRKILWV